MGCLTLEVICYPLQTRIWVLKYFLWKCLTKLPEPKKTVNYCCKKKRGGTKMRERAQLKEQSHKVHANAKIMMLHTKLSPFQTAEVWTSSILRVLLGYYLVCRMKDFLQAPNTALCVMNPPIMRSRYTTLCFVIVQYSWHTSYKLFKLCCRYKIMNFLPNFCTFLHITIG